MTPSPEPTEAANLVATPMLLESRLGPLALITMIATFGTALDITLAELALETFLPADAETLATLNRYAAERRGSRPRARNVRRVRWCSDLGAWLADGLRAARSGG